ncbi:hypothetical protein ANN_05261 [Periplaneta americana]|uniref:Uncharacterized protein n=1 Tax=Periplaneta americana TaxID=6978 RepID=A0ABQ8TCH2_PERAM|nr:hypothetical protein ANN_05261 [Periplaneta americana]
MDIFFEDECKRCSCKGGSRSRYGCPENETLAHVQGQCDHELLLRNARHDKVRSLIAIALKKKSWEVEEEVSSIATNGSSRRIDILMYSKTTKHGFIIDPRNRYERSAYQPEEVLQEKKDIYGPTIEYFKEKYHLKHIEVIGLFIGARGVIPKLFNNLMFRKQFDLPKSLIDDIRPLGFNETIYRTAAVIQVVDLEMNLFEKLETDGPRKRWEATFAWNVRKHGKYSPSIPFEILATASVVCWSACWLPDQEIPGSIRIFLEEEEFPGCLESRNLYECHVTPHVGEFSVIAIDVSKKTEWTELVSNTSGDRSDIQGHPVKCTKHGMLQAILEEALTLLRCHVDSVNTI